MPTITPLVGRIRRAFGELILPDSGTTVELRPDPLTALYRTGPDPWRVLLFGGGVLMGLGCRSHELGLPGRVADRIAELTGRGVNLEVVVEDQPTSPRALTALAALRLRRFDAVVVVLGEPPSWMSSRGTGREAMAELIQVLSDGTTPATGLFVADSTEVMTASLARSAGRHPSAAQVRLSARVAETAGELCASTGRISVERLRPSLLDEAAGGRFADATYHGWADRIAGRIIAFASADAADSSDSPKAFRNRPDEERLRQRAVDSLRSRLRSDETDDRLQREVAAARAMYRVDGAAVNLIDGDVTRAQAATEPMEPCPRAEAMCDLTLHTDGLTLINDTWLDPRTVDNPRTQGIGGTRFYAAFPIQTWDGYQIGTICIWDREPRNLRPSDLDALQAVAARVEQTIWAQALRAA